MVKVAVVGWYGTETLGDMAILDGIIKVFASIDSNINLHLGSLYPFYSKRDVYENKELYSYGLEAFQISVFDICDDNSLRGAIDQTDVLILGGGPLMDFKELFPIKKAFKYAHKMGKPTVIMGCGFGPVNRFQYLRVIEELFRYSSLICFRDSESISLARQCINRKFNYQSIGDPAVISIEEYKKRSTFVKANYVAVNLRIFPTHQYGADGRLAVDEAVCMLVGLAENFDHVKLVPMHTFGIGNDDRCFLSQVKYKCKKNNISLYYKPLTLSELYDVYGNAIGNVGMRYHAIVMQTILNGNNYIINYNNPKSGKTIGFLNNECATQFYADSIVNLKEDRNLDTEKVVKSLKNSHIFFHSASSIKGQYEKVIRELIGR